MPKIQIPKEQVLDAALQLVIREGHAQMNIKTVAQELGRSTQTISWTFGNMENFRNELIVYALECFDRKLVHNNDNPIAEFVFLGKTYVDIAYDEPNLLRFIFANNAKKLQSDSIGYVFDEEKNKKLKDAVMALNGMDEATATNLIKFAMLCVHGLVNFLLDGTLSYERETAYKILHDIGVACLVSNGVAEEEVKALLSVLDVK